MPRVSPIDPVEHISQLRGRDRHHAVGRRWPDEVAPLQALRVERHADPIMPNDFNEIAPDASKDVQIAGMRVPTQNLLNLQGQSVHALAHVGAADRQPHPDTRGNRDHRRANAATTAATKAGDTEAGIRTRASPENSISIAAIDGGALTLSPAGATTT